MVNSRYPRSNHFHKNLRLMVISRARVCIVPYNYVSHRLQIVEDSRASIGCHLVFLLIYNRFCISLTTETTLRSVESFFTIRNAETKECGSGGASGGRGDFPPSLLFSLAYSLLITKNVDRKWSKLLNRDIDLVSMKVNYAMTDLLREASKPIFCTRRLIVIRPNIV